ncbi:Clp protease N-terminal domain-containing protein [Eleftheria terrae]|uniref:Clp protease N-terminal domain-containing protein n=1 Tax=Eleftheria terrae TaxID=1597781 RepID=UPI00263BA6EE|nr:Clp protease N-terminal domain-containing protein [Eleftheria terrae]WKB53101.1 Clp protease N-terminal domain-containing protein [Eleftheria terrae]
MKTIRTLCEGAERHARQHGQAEPGAEHFLLAALDLPDGTARRTLQRLQLPPERLAQALAQQYQDALRHVGVNADAFELAPAEAGHPGGHGLYKASGSGQAVVQALARHEGRAPGSPLLGAHVLAVIASMKHGVAVRTLKALGADPAAVRAAASEEAAAAAT